MDLLVVRHGIAEDTTEWEREGRADAARPLTADGAKKMRQAAKGLRTQVPRVDVIGTSPLTRAVETADILAGVYGGPKPVEVPVLAPGEDPAAVAAWLATVGTREAVAIVGHEPGLSTAVTWLVSGKEERMLELKKGGACLVALGQRIARGEALLRWLLTAGHLRKLGD